MANEVGPGAVQQSNTTAYTLVDKAVPATISGDLTAIRLVCSASSEITAKFRFFINDIGESLVTPVGDLIEVTLPIQSMGLIEWTAPGDFASQAITEGWYIGCWLPTNGLQTYTSGGAGGGYWYKSGDYTETAFLNSNVDEPGLIGIAGDISGGGAVGIIPLVMAHYRRLRT